MTAASRPPEQPLPLGGTGPTAQRVREGLGAVASPALVQHLLRSALYASGRRRIPDGGAALRRFLAHPLDTLVRQLLGHDAADLVQGELAALVRRFPSAHAIERRALTRARLVVATRDAVLIAAARRVFGDRVEVVAVGDVLQLLDAAQAIGRPVLLVDVVLPVVHPSTLVTVWPDLPVGTRVVIWRARATTRERLAVLGPLAPRWQIYEPGVALNSLADAVIGD